jgi:hypothetical protein
MKSTRTLRSTLLHSTLALAVVGMAWLPGRALAQAKGGEKLMQLSARKSATVSKAVVPGPTVAMTCPKCKDKWVTIMRPTSKGSQQEARIVPQHQCPTCQNKAVVSGMGKQAKEKVMHLCKNCGSQDMACCATTKGGAPTSGMERSEHQH